MTAKIVFFPVGNGDMTLISLADRDGNSGIGTTILVDCCLSQAKEGEIDNQAELLKRLNRDEQGRPYVDVFCLSHPDEDHCRGLERCFHLGAPSSADDEEKILIGEMWSSPVVFRRASKNWSLCNDAKAWRKEAKRRVEIARESGQEVYDFGDAIKLIGIDYDENGEDKNEDLGFISYVRGQTIDSILGQDLSLILEANLLGPFDESDIDGEEDDKLASNDSSVITNFSISSSETHANFFNFLTGGDAGVDIWEKLDEESSQEELTYDFLQCPHHCSWRSLSHDSWSETEDPQVSDEALSALSNARDNCIIVSSSKPIKEEDSDPPCYGAKLQYEAIANSRRGEFICTGETPSEDAPKPFEIVIGEDGHVVEKGSASSALLRTGAIAAGPIEHGVP